MKLRDWPLTVMVLVVSPGVAVADAGHVAVAELVPPELGRAPTAVPEALSSSGDARKPSATPGARLGPVNSRW